MITIKNYGSYLHEKITAEELAARHRIKPGYYVLIDGVIKDTRYQVADEDHIEFIFQNPDRSSVARADLSEAIISVVDTNLIIRETHISPSENYFDVIFYSNSDELFQKLNKWLEEHNRLSFVEKIFHPDTNTTRIYFSCWDSLEHLLAYKKRWELVWSSDHRNLGPTMDLFHFSNISPGIAFWHPQGFQLWHALEEYIRSSNRKYGCLEIKTPLIADPELWSKSGHQTKYQANMFKVSGGGREYILRPMNCPTCAEVFKNRAHSYKDLPVRLTEFGLVHRNEASGAMHGLFRAKSFTQDDGHVFCTPEQVEQEINTMLVQSFEVYEHLGFAAEAIAVKLALRPTERIGTDTAWNTAEQSLQASLTNRNIQFEILADEGAFYGPKIEFHIRDNLGRSWQCGTIQLDFFLPERLDILYVDTLGQKRYPIMIHRAILGSMERFLGILLEHHQGRLPLWLAPTQVAILGISQLQNNYVDRIMQYAEQHNLRAISDKRNDTLNFKLRHHLQKRVPVIGVVGPREEATDTISIRLHNGKSSVISLEDFIHLFKEHHYRPS